MSRKYEEIIEILDYGELMRFKNDIDSGSINIKKLLDEKIKAKLKEHEKSCVTCSSELKFYNSNNYTLVFGPDDFKKKASFCGLDCLGYFTSKLNSVKSKTKEDNVNNTGNLI